MSEPWTDRSDAQRILAHHQNRPYLNDPHTRPTLREVLPESEAERWYRLPWYLVASAGVGATLMALGLYSVLEAVGTWWRGW